MASTAVIASTAGAILVVSVTAATSADSLGLPHSWDGAYGYDNADGYCANYRSYDPASGTYLGRSGYRYYCP